MHGFYRVPAPPKRKTEKPEFALNGTAPNGNRHPLSTIGSSKAGSPAYANPHFHAWRTTYKDLRSMEVDGDTLAGEGFPRAQHPGNGFRSILSVGS